MALSAEHTRAGYLQRACLEIYQEHRHAGTLPTSLRFLFYELEGRGVVAKSYPGKSVTGGQEVSRAFMTLREEGLVSWDDIVDETRSLHNPHRRATVAEAAAALLEHLAPGGLVVHVSAAPGPLEAWRQFSGSFAEAFPDLRLTVLLGGSLVEQRRIRLTHSRGPLGRCPSLQ